jgi:hypothetical protein
MSKEKQTKTNETASPTEIIVNKHNDLKIGFAFTLEDAEGKQIQLSDILTFRSALEPGMIGSIIKRIEGTLRELGQDYFLTLVRDYISKKQEALYIAESLKNQSNVVNADVKYVANGVTEIIGDNFDNPIDDTEADLKAQIADQLGGDDTIPIE